MNIVPQAGSARPQMFTEPSPTRLQRTVRFSINADGSTQGANNFVSTPAPRGLARFYEITLGVMGQPNPDTGYLIGIQEVDALVRDRLVPIIAAQCEQDSTRSPASMLPDLWQAASDASSHPLVLLSWWLTPYYGVEMTDTSAQAERVLFRQSFSFAAAHRLHTTALSDEENARFFGKCNNLSGHGHNYRIEPTIALPLPLLETIDAQLEIQETVNTTLIDHLDHKFLNTDCDWFNQDRGGVIPSIEHIARVCFEQLAPEISRIGQGAELVRIQAWETEKTSAIFPA